MMMVTSPPLSQTTQMMRTSYQMLVLHAPLVHVHLVPAVRPLPLAKRLAHGPLLHRVPAVRPLPWPPLAHVLVLHGPSARALCIMTPSLCNQQMCGCLIWLLE